MKKTIIWIAILAVIGFVGYRGVTRYKAGRKKGVIVEEGKAVPVEVDAIRRGNIEERLSFTGDIKAKDQILVYPKVAGKLIENKVQEGNRVKKGEVIAIIDRDITGLKFEPAEVTSPIDGIVGRIYLDKGSGVSPPEPSPSMGTPIAMIVSMNTVKVKINIIERDLPKVKKGQKAEVRVDAYPEEVFVGRLTGLSPVVDLLSRAAPAEISIGNLDHRLKPGYFARVRLLVAEHKDVLVIPEDCILKSGTENYVFVVNGEIARRREVKLGLSEGDRVEVLEGLKEGETIVTVGQQMLKDGAEVKIVTKN